MTELKPGKYLITPIGDSKEIEIIHIKGNSVHVKYLIKGIAYRGIMNLQDLKTNFKTEEIK